VTVGHHLQPLALGSALGYRAGGGNGQGRQADRQKRITTGQSLPYPPTGPSGGMDAMPTPSEHTPLSLEGRLGEHARTSWPQLEQLHVRPRGAFAYVEAELADGEQVTLMGLRYTGAVGRWGFALYYAGSDCYEDSLLPTGSPTGHPRRSTRLRLPAPSRRPRHLTTGHNCPASFDLAAR
jgi:hypothetical protein